MRVISDVAYSPGTGLTILQIIFRVVWVLAGSLSAEDTINQRYVPVEPRYPIVISEQNWLPPLQLLNHKLDRYGLVIDSMLIQDAGYVKQVPPITGGFAYTFYGLQGRLDCQKLMNWKGAEFLAAMLVGAQYTASEETRIIAANDNIADLSGVELAELWWRQRFWHDRAAVQLGLNDCLGAFGVIPAAENYINFKFFSPAGLFWFCPTFPNQALGGIASVSADWWWLRGGIYDGAKSFAFTEPLDNAVEKQPGNGLFYIAETELRWSLKDYFGCLSLGGWHHSGCIPGWSGCLNNGANGWYLILQQQLMPNALAGPKSDGLCLWGSLGQSGPSQVTPFTWDAALGISWVGTILHGQNDLAGIGISYLQAPSDVEPLDLNRRELTLELYAGLEIFPGIILQPDLQLIHNPLFLSEAGWATVATLRLSMVF